MLKVTKHGYEWISEKNVDHYILSEGTFIEGDPFLNDI